MNFLHQYEPPKPGKVNRPGEDINPTTKDTEWYRGIAEYYFSTYYYNGGQSGRFNFQFRETIDLLRAYGDGNQPEHIYKNLLLKGRSKGTGSSVEVSSGPFDQDAGQINLMNVDWSVFSVASKFMRIIKNSFRNTDYNIDVEVLDQNAGLEKLNMKNRMEVLMRLRDTDKMLRDYGILANDDWVPADKKHLEWWASIGGFKLKFEIAMQKIIMLGFDLSKWSEEIFNNVVEDLVNLNAFVLKDEYDENLDKVHCRYVDVKNFCALWDRKYGFSKSPFMAELETTTIAELWETGEFSHEDIHKIAKAYTGYHHNDGKVDTTRFWGNPVCGQWRFSDFEVPVFNIEFKSVDTEYKTTRRNKDGEERYYRSTWGEERNNDNYKTKKFKTHFIRSCKWIVGSKFVYGCGKVANMKRNNPKVPEFSYHPVALSGQSLTQQAMRVYDRIQLDELKFQQACSREMPNGFAIDISAIRKLKMNNRTYSPKKVIEVLVQSGILFYEGSKIDPHVPQTGRSKPYEQILGGLGNILNEYMLKWQTNMEQLSEIFGIPRVAANPGSTNKDMGLGVTKIMLDSAQGALGDIVNAYRIGKEKAARGMAVRIQTVLKFHPEAMKGYENAIGSEQLKVLRDAPNLGNYEMGVKMSMKPDQATRSLIIESAIESVKAGKNGQPGITQSDFNYIVQLVDKGLLEEAQTYLAFRENEREKVQKQWAEKMEKQKLDLAARNEQMKKASEVELKKALSDIEVEKERQIKAILLEYEKQKAEQVTIPVIAKEAELEATGVHVGDSVAN